MNVLRKEMAHSHKIGYNNYTLESELKKKYKLKDESLNARTDIYVSESQVEIIGKLIAKIGYYKGILNQFHEKK